MFEVTGPFKRHEASHGSAVSASTSTVFVGFVALIQNRDPRRIPSPAPPLQSSQLFDHFSISRQFDSPAVQHGNQVQIKLGMDVKKFESYDRRNTALTECALQGIPRRRGDEATGHSSVQIYQRYFDLQAADVANAFGTSQIDKRFDKQKKGVSHK